MFTQTHDQTRVLDLSPRHAAPNPLGNRGNLRFNAGPDVTPRGSLSRAALSRIGDAFATLKFSARATSQAARTQRGELDRQARASRDIGNLLGSLTAPASDVRARSDTAKALARLSGLFQGDLSNLPGGRESLLAHLGRLKVLDLSALRGGVLFDTDARQAVLDQIEPSELRRQAARMLDQIAMALNQRVAHEVVDAPLRRIDRLLSAGWVDESALQAQLGRLFVGLGMLDVHGSEGGEPSVHLLDVYFQSLPQDRAVALLGDLAPRRLRIAAQALLRIGDSSERRQALIMLERIPQSLERATHARIQPDLLRLTAAQYQTHDRRAVRKAMSNITPLASFLPGNTAAEVWERVDALSERMAEGMAGVFRTLAAAPLDMPDLMRQLQALSSAELQRTEQVALLGRSGQKALLGSGLAALLGHFDPMAALFSFHERPSLAASSCRQALSRLDMQEMISGLEAWDVPLLRGMGSACHRIAFHSVDRVRAGEDAADRVTKKLTQVGVTGHLLDAMVAALDARFRSFNVPVAEGVSEPPDSFYQALQAEYGVAYDPVAGTVAVSLTGS